MKRFLLCAVVLMTLVCEAQANPVYLYNCDLENCYPVELNGCEIREGLEFDIALDEPVLKVEKDRNELDIYLYTENYIVTIYNYFKPTLKWYVIIKELISEDDNVD